MEIVYRRKTENERLLFLPSSRCGRLALYTLYHFERFEPMGNKNRPEQSEIRFYSEPPRRLELPENSTHHSRTVERAAFCTPAARAS